MGCTYSGCPNEDKLYTVKLLRGRTAELCETHALYAVKKYGIEPDGWDPEEVKED